MLSVKIGATNVACKVFWIWFLWLIFEIRRSYSSPLGKFESGEDKFETLLRSALGYIIHSMVIEHYIIHAQHLRITGEVLHNINTAAKRVRGLVNWLSGEPEAATAAEIFACLVVDQVAIWVGLVLCSNGCGPVSILITFAPKMI